MTPDNGVELILTEIGERKRPVKGDVPVAIVLVQHAFEGRASVFKDVVVQKHVSFFHLTRFRLDLDEGAMRWMRPS